MHRLVEEDEEGKPDQFQAKKLPSFKAIEQYLRSGGSYWKKTETGWSMSGFLLAE
ncbi:MAG: hypothetical protein AAFV88_25435 [Planctomycetota bacterium]